MVRSIAAALALGAASMACRGEAPPVAFSGDASSSSPPEGSAALAPPATATAAPTQTSTVAPADMLPPGSPFQGEIAVAVTEDASGKLPTKYVFDVKDSHVRLAAMGVPQRAVIDLDGQRAYTLDQITHSYEQRDLARTAPLPKPVKTGQKDTIAGTDCETWTIDDGVEKVDACVAPNISFFAFAPDPAPGRVESGWAAALSAAKVFPLRVVARDRTTGKVKYHAEASRLFRGPVRDDLFVVPSAYKPADLGKETRGMSLP